MFADGSEPAKSLRSRRRSACATHVIALAAWTSLSGFPPDSRDPDMGVVGRKVPTAKRYLSGPSYVSPPTHPTPPPQSCVPRACPLQVINLAKLMLMGDYESHLVPQPRFAPLR